MDKTLCAHCGHLVGPHFDKRSTKSEKNKSGYQYSLLGCPGYKASQKPKPGPQKPKE